MDKATFFTILVAALTQLLGACYNYQYLNALGVELSIHPLTLEDNIQTALTQLPTFVSSILFPLVLGFAFNFHTPTVKIKPKEHIKRTQLQEAFSYLYKMIFAVALGSLAFIFLPNRIASYACVFIGLSFLLYISMNKIEVFSLKDDVPTILSSLIFIGFLVVASLYDGEIQGTLAKQEKNVNYIIKIKNEQEEFHSATSFRSYANDVLLVQNGKVTFIKKDTVQEITVLK
jgi:hypothetical protein